MKLRFFFILLFIVSTALSTVYFVDFLRTHTVWHFTLTSSFIFYCLGSILLLLSAHFIRAYKSKLLLDLVRESKPSTLFNGVAVGFLFNTLLPFRLGEFIRAYYVGDALSISRTVVFISIVIERIVDGTILGVAFIIASLLIHSVSPEAAATLLRFGISLLAISVILSSFIYIIKSENRLMLHWIRNISGLFNNRISDRLRFVAWSGIYGTKLISNRFSVLVKFYLASVGMWVLYFASTALVVLASFHTLSLTKLWFIIQATYAGISIPSGPGYIGTFHVTVANLIQKIGLMNTASFSLLIWVVITVPISLVGLFVLIKQRLGEKKKISKQEVFINKLYRENDISTEFSHFLDAYLKGEKINHILTKAELSGRYKLIKSFRGGSNAQTMLVWQKQELRVKKITLPQFAPKLKDQAQWLIEREDLKHIPQVVAQVRTPQYYSFDLAYEESYFPFFDYIHSQTVGNSIKVLDKILAFMDTSIYEPVAAENGLENVLNYIEGKVLTKASDTAIISSSINKLLAYPKIKVNGKTYVNLLTVIEKIKKNKRAMADLSSYDESPIHGDLTVDNLIVTPRGNFMVIDPNNENQVSAPVVDYGKLYQSIHSGYEFLIQLEGCVVKQNSVDFEDSKSQKYEAIFTDIDKMLKRRLSPANYRTILFHEAVHYCRMLPYRVNLNPRTVPVFYATAVKLFNEYLNQYAKSKN